MAMSNASRNGKAKGRTQWEAKQAHMKANRGERQRAAASAISSAIEAQGWADLRVDGLRPTRSPIMAKPRY